MEFEIVVETKNTCVQKGIEQKFGPQLDYRKNAQDANHLQTRHNCGE